ncbi:DinB family protein [uncultured Friedmanniella sp.]|uniref:DinB family protein n=1 Tax=uncultured Friedmanniella sp. TaxID=335381 RepID=UPI0035C98E97
MTEDPTPLDWTELLADQCGWLWSVQVPPRLTGLADEEYFWEPVPGCWSVRPRGRGVAEEVGAGAMVLDVAFPAPDPAPVTTIAWRLAHLLVGVFGERNARYFGGPDVSYHSTDYPPTAADPLHRLDREVDRWLAGVRGLTGADLVQHCREPGFESDPMAGLVQHINREAIHHCAEIALLRDLFAHRPRPAPGATS